MTGKTDDAACPGEVTLSAYYDGELCAGESRRIAAHVAGCDACAQTLEGYAAVSRMFAEAASPAASPGFGARVAASAVRGGDSLMRMAAGLTAAAACIMLASLVYIFAGAPPAGAALEDRPFAAISMEMQEPALPESPPQEDLARYILADLPSEVVR